jgi:3',5'-nucleoside bisphosphate phosphatase
MAVDMHCHSLFSVDGMVTPGEMADAMAAAGITIMSLTDHNSMDGLAACRARAAELGMKFFDGVEFDAMWRGREYHFLAYGIDPGNPALRRLCAAQFAQYALNFERFLPVLERRYGVRRQKLLSGLKGRYRSHPAPVLNKWYARTFLLAEGVFADEQDAARQMREVAAEAEQGVKRSWKWAGVEAVRDAVHGAGGILLLAHVANHARGNLRGQLALIAEFMNIGLDGFELYHPSNMMEPHFDGLVAEARRMKCALSGGSDTHCDATRDSVPERRPQIPDWVIATIEAALAGIKH